MGLSFHFLGTAAKDVGHAAATVARGNTKPGGGVFGFLDNQLGPPNSEQAKANHNLGAKTAQQVQKVPVVGRADTHIVNAGKSIAQGTIGAGIPIGNEIYNRVVAPAANLPQQTFHPQDLGGAGTTLLGDKPILSPSQTFTATRQAGHGTPFSFLAAGAVAAGAIPIGGGEAKAAQGLVKASTTKDAIQALTKSGVDETIAKKIAPAVAQTKDPNIIKNIIDNAHNPPALPRSPLEQLTPGGPPKTAGQGTKLPTELPKQTSATKRAFLSVRGEISKAGLHGQEIADKLQETRNVSERGQAEFIQKIPTVLNLNKNEFTHFVNSLEELDKGAKNVDVGPKVQQAINEWTQNIPSIHERATATGPGKANLDVGNLGQNYFPRNYTELLSNQEGLNKAANHLVETGQADNIGEALQQLQFMKSRYSTPYGHFENSRTLDLPEYDKSKDALVNYISGSYDRIANAEQFGPKGEIARQLISNAGAEGHDIAHLLDRYQIATGIKKHNATAEKASSAIRGVNRFRSLGLSALLNVTQSNNTAAVSGIWNTAGAAFKTFSSSEKQYIKDTGVIIDSVLNNLREQTGLAGKITGKVTAPAFGLVERFNRSVSAVAGKDYATKLASKGDEKSLNILREKLGVQGDIGKKLTPDQEIQAGRKMVEITQFKVDPQDLPGWVDSPGGKLVAQFRTFGYKQTGFIYNQVLKEAAKGNALPLTRFLAVGIPLGVAAGTARNVLKGQTGAGQKGNQDSPATDAFHQMIDGLANVGGFGLGPTDAYFLGSNAKSQRFPEYVASTVGGPTAGLAVGSTIDASQAANGNFNGLERRGLKSLSSIGPALSNKLVPYSETSKDQKAVLDQLKQEGASKEQVTTYEQFFSSGKSLKGEEGKARKEIDAVLKKEGPDSQTAYNIAKAYNAKVEKTYSKWVKDYAQKYGTDDLETRYTQKFIDPDNFSDRYDSLSTPIINK